MATTKFSLATKFTITSSISGTNGGTFIDLTIPLQGRTDTESSYAVGEGTFSQHHLGIKHPVDPSVLEAFSSYVQHKWDRGSIVRFVSTMVLPILSRPSNKNETSIAMQNQASCTIRPGSRASALEYCVVVAVGGLDVRAQIPLSLTNPEHFECA
eukprot:3307808-Amphidinium_carterae.1